MVQGKASKNTTLILSAVVLLLCLVDVTYNEVGLFDGASWINRAIFPLFHGSIYHALLNVWCLLSIVFYYNIPIGQFICAYIVSVTIPIDFLSNIIPSLPTDTPIVGLSGVCYTLLGKCSWRSTHKVYYNIFITINLILGFIIPNICGWLHLYCYAAGLLIGALNKPIR